MHDVVLIKLVGCVLTAVFASAIFARDAGLRVHRLMAGFLASTSFWALCEVLWNVEPDPERAVVYVRLSALGWIWLGPLVFDLFLELSHQRTRLVALRRWAYAAAIVSLPLYVLTPWSVASVVPVDWGWGFRFGPLFWVAYASAALPPFVAACHWRTVHPAAGSRGERRISTIAFLAIAIANLVATTTDVALPALEIDVPPMGSTSIALACLALAWGLRRYGYSLFNPSSLAPEILETFADGLAIVENDGRLRTSNEALDRLVGAAAGELAGTPVSELLPGFESGSGTLAGPVETDLVTRVGANVPVSVTSSLLCHERSGVLGEVIVLRDLREVMVLRDRLVNSGRLAAVGELSTSIAHEINDPVANVRTHLARLRTQWAGLCVDVRRRGLRGPIETVLSEGGELIDECLEGVDRVAGIVHDVGGFTRSEPGERLPTDVNELVEDAVRIARSRTPEGVSLECRTGDVPKVECSPSEIMQVVLNLLLNAIHAVGAGGRVLCETASSGGFVLVRVEDDGCGIPEDVRDRIFDPFFTTKPVGEGTGLGLSISYHIVRAHLGEIRLESGPSRGTVFTIELPASGHVGGLVGR